MTSPLVVEMYARFLWAIDLPEPHTLDAALAVGRDRVPDVYWNQAEFELAKMDGRDVVQLRDERPHSRACGIAFHLHGIACAKDCPTCGGQHGRSACDAFQAPPGGGFVCQRCKREYLEHPEASVRGAGVR